MVRLGDRMECYNCCWHGTRRRTGRPKVPCTRCQSTRVFKVDKEHYKPQRFWRWSIEEDALLLLYLSMGYAQDWIAERLGRRYDAVRYRIKVLRDRIGYQRPYSWQ